MSNTDSVSVTILLDEEWPQVTRLTNKEPLNLVSPGDAITTEKSFMGGHGTHLSMDGDALQSTVAGVVLRVNKLVSVKPMKTRYNGEIG